MLIINRPLPQPKLLATSPEVAQLVGWDEKFLSSDAFLRFFSGDMNAMKIVHVDQHSNLEISKFQSWATPYALSIYGEEIYHNCPFKTGNGYGDGRAISVAEVCSSRTNSRLEFQLKGAGTTPFSRSADGRAVLRSSIREFLASEAMFHLGVSTTRALSLIVSETGMIERPWFSPQKQMSLDDIRLREYPPEFRKEIVKYANGQPDVLIQERMAIACRVAPSFLRVGHIELFARRYRKTLVDPSLSVEQTQRLKELKMIVFHMVFREYPRLLPESCDGVKSLNQTEFQSICLTMLKECSARICNLTAAWVRVGYCQGNFNSDNCLVGGRTMDYGPFGFIEKYEKTWNMWTGGGEKYSFRYQHLAGERNFFSLASSIALLFDDSGKHEVMTQIIPAHEHNANAAIEDIYRQKLGFTEWKSSHISLFQRLDDYLEATEADYTLFWRQLALIPERIASLPLTSSDLSTVLTKEIIFGPIRDVFYSSLTLAQETEWCSILREWINILLNEENCSSMELINRSIQMRTVSPKYVPREWMLVEAYKSAENWNLEPLKKLQELFKRPYDEQPEYEREFYRKMSTSHLDKGGLTCMT